MSLKEHLLGIPRDITPTSSTYAHASGTTEDTAITLTITSKTKINNILLDMTDFTKNTTIRTKVGGITVDTLDWNTSMDDLQLLGTMVAGSNVTVTFQSGTAEGASRDMDYEVW